jgi:hypothetical protein
VDGIMKQTSLGAFFAPMSALRSHALQRLNSVIMEENLAEEQKKKQ